MCRPEKGSGVRARVYIYGVRTKGGHLKRARWSPPICAPRTPALHVPYREGGVGVRGV